VRSALGVLSVVRLAAGLALLLLPQPIVFAQLPSPPVVPPLPAPTYRLAFNAGIAVGQAGWGTELAGISEVGARVHLMPWVGVGLSYLQFSAGNNEAYPPFEFNALEVSGAWRPVVGKWFDPFVQLGVVGVLGSTGGYMGTETTSRFGLEGMVGLDFVVSRPAVRLPVAAGLHARSGFTNSYWTLMGLHLELRI
jgi:hypothetical protein